MLVMTGCTIISPPRYSETEYRTLAEMATVVDLGTCDKDTVTKLGTMAAFLENYTKYQSNNTASFESAVSIREQVKDLSQRVGEKVLSETFCSRKLQVLKETIGAMQHGSGGKLR
jgi:hypothetical protein